MLQKVLISLYFLLASSSLFATNYQSDSYGIYINSTTNEVYFESNEKFVLIASDINIPLFVSDGPSIVLIPDGSGGYTIQTIDSLPSGLTPATDLDVLIGDFNGDSFQDIFLTPTSNSVAANNGIGIALYGTAEDEPTRIEAYTQIQGIALVNAIVSVDDTDNDGRSELIITSSDGIREIASAGSSGFETERSVSPGSLVGNTPVEFDVTYGGAASYKVPLNVPTGAAGLRPDISLNYNSQFGNGVMGLGWQLASGLARIEQCYKRNTDQVINCLNGEELVDIGGGYYRTEIDSGVLVQSLNSTTFQLHFENGDTKTLTRYLASPNVYLESTHAQRGGASYSVDWLVDTTNREPLVNTISYQGNTIQFNYEARNDRRNGYWLGAVRNRTQRLQSVSASADGQVYRQYNVIYAYDTVSNVSKITNIQECAGTGECLQPLTFGWTSSGSVGLAAPVSASSRTYGLINHDNDGRDDRNTTEGDDTRVLGDFDGDGRDDTLDSYIVEHNNEDGHTYGANILLSSGATVALFSSHHGDSVKDAIDLNGDNRDELLHDIGSRISTLSASGNLSSVNVNLDTLHDYCYGAPEAININGDPLPDLVYRVNGRSISDNTECDERYEDQFFVNKGDFQFVAYTSMPDVKRFQEIDINGDGLFDAVEGGSFELSRGDGSFVPMSISGHGSSFTLIDLNVDGLLDIIEGPTEDAESNVRERKYIRYNNGVGGFGDRIDLGVRTLEGLAGDLNGDGNDDYIWRYGSNSTRIQYGQSNRSYIDTFTDSYGNQHQVEYGKLTDSDVYTRDPYVSGGNFPDAQPYQQALTVVKSITTPDHEVYYKYAGARLHNGEHGYLGFKSITSVLAKEDANGLPKSLVTVSYLNQNYPLVGKLQTVKKKVYGRNPGDNSLRTAADIINQINYELEGDHLVAMLDGTAVGATTQSQFVEGVANRGDPGEATGIDFTGQMNSYFEWRSQILTGGVRKPYLAEKVVDHLQLSNDALTKTERERYSWVVASSGHYMRLGSSIYDTYDATGQNLQRQQMDIVYENTDVYGRSSSFLMGQTTDTTSYLDTLSGQIDSNTVEKEYDYYSNELVQYEWLNRTDIKGTQTYYQYDSYGNPTVTTLSAVSADANRSEAPRTMSKTYSNQGKYLATDTNSLGHQSTYDSYSVHGLPRRVTTPTGLVSFHLYDALGRLERTTDHLNNNHYTYRGYCSSGGVGCTNNAYIWEHVIPAGGAETYNYWDRKGNKVRMATQSLQAGQWIVDAWEYDQYSRETKASVPLLQSLSSTVSFAATSDYHFTQNSYDELNRVVRKQLPGESRVVTKDYANELAVITIDPAGRRTENHTNALGQLIHKVQPDNTRVQFSYNAQGLVTRQYYPRLDAEGNIVNGQTSQVVNTYDRYGNQISLTDPNQGNWVYQYNAFGELIQQTDARNQSTYFTYDALGRMHTQRDSETYSVWVYDTEEIGLIDAVTQYNISSLSTGAQAALTPATVASTSGVTTSWQQNTDYNDINKLPEWVQTRQQDRNGQLLISSSTMEYDNFGRMQYAQLPALYQNQGSLSAPRLRYSYSSSGYLNRIADRDSTTVYQQINAIDAFGNISDQVLAGNVELYRGYRTSTGWATTLQAVNGGGLVIDQSYGNYNALGHIGSRDDASYYNGGGDVQSWTDTFSYGDSLGQQLTGVSTQYIQNINGIALNENWSHSYRYDALGNMRSKQVTVSSQLSNTGTINYQYNNPLRPHQLTSNTGSLTRNYSYDVNGNTLSDGGKTFTYNPWNKVRQITQGSNSTRFEYGPDRKRYLRVDQQGSGSTAVTTETLYVGEGYERVSTIDSGTPSNNSVQHRYHIHGIALITQTESGNTETTHSLISDYQDSVLAIADQSGNLSQRFRYTPFGEQVDVSQGITGSYSFTTKGYTSHEHIEGMDIIHMNGRIYDPVIGRMVQSDPIIQAPQQILSYNRYSYVWNNPMNRIDPTGYSSENSDGSDSIGPDGDGPEQSGTSSNLSSTDDNIDGSDPANGDKEEDIEKVDPESKVPEKGVGISDPENRALAMTPAGGLRTAIVGIGARIGKAIKDGLKGLKNKSKAKEKAKQKEKAREKEVKDSKPKSLDDILESSKPGRKTKGKTKQHDKDGGLDQANKDFDDLKPENVKDIETEHGPGRTGTLPDDKSVTVRPGSTDGRPTLEVRNRKNGRGVEIRYND